MLSLGPGWQCKHFPPLATLSTFVIYDSYIHSQYDDVEVLIPYGGDYTHAELPRRGVRNCIKSENATMMCVKPHIMVGIYGVRGECSFMREHYLPGIYWRT